MSTKAFKFLKDTPIGKDADGFYGFYHKNIAPALKEIIENETCVHTIGLFGKWGTGKSTIIKLLKDDGIKDAVVVEFDCWKYEKDSLRRQLLLQIAKDLELGQKYIDGLEKEFYFSVSEKIGERMTVSGAQIKKVAILAGAFAVPILFAAILIYRDPLAQWREFLGFIFSLVVASAVLADKFLTEDFKKIIMISPITASKNQMDSAELFEKSFIKVVNQAKKLKKLIIVIDNLDRVDSKIATEVLSTLKTFLEIKDESLKDKQVIFLVPCDFDAIKKAAPSAELAHEFLRKIFNIGIWTPEFINADIHGFIKRQIKETGDISSLLNNEDVILVIETAFGNSPREIKQFLNNLVSSIVVASNTEVKDIIEANVAYLAKVQVLMQRYPEAYQALKQFWYAPESIATTYTDMAAEQRLEEGSRNLIDEFSNFMLGTSRITVADAEPFIYFKLPVVNTSLNNPDPIRLSLIEGNEVEAKALIQQETDKDAVIDFVLSLLKKYQGQPEILKNIFKTHLSVFNDESLTNRAYVNDAVLLLDSKIWPYFKELSVDVIFPFLLSSQALDQSGREKVLERYVLALETEEFKTFQSMELLKSILSNFIEHQELLTTEQKKKIGLSIEQFYIMKEEIVSLFVGKPNVNVFLTRKALQYFIESIDNNNFDIRKDILTQLKELVIQRKMFPLLFARFNGLLTFSNSQASDYTDSKNILLEHLFKLILTFQPQLKEVEVAHASEFGRLLIQTFQNTSVWDNKKVILLILIYISHRTEPPMPSEIEAFRLQFIQNAGSEPIRALFTQCGDKYSATTISTSLPNLYGRIMSERDFGLLIYSFASTDDRTLILVHAINASPNLAIKLVSQISPKDYVRIEVVKLFLEKAATLSSQERVEIYEFIKDKLNLKDDVAVKELGVSQIKELLTQDNDANAEVGFNFLTSTNFLGDEKKREIAKAVLEFLRTPGKIITEQNRHSLMTLTSLYGILQETPKKDIIYALFNGLQSDRSLQTLEVIVEALLTTKPVFPEYEKDFKDLLAVLKSWPEGKNREYVIQNLAALKSEPPSKAEQEYWTELDSLLPQPEEEKEEE